MISRVTATVAYQRKAPVTRLPGAFLRVVATICMVATPLLSGCDNSAVDLNDPRAIYENYCFACHDTGAAGAPRMDQAAFWQSVSGDKERLYQSTINGVRAMPRKGTCLSCSDEQLQRVVDWMVDTSASASTVND